MKKMLFLLVLIGIFVVSHPIFASHYVTGGTCSFENWTEEVCDGFTCAEFWEFDADLDTHEAEIEDETCEFPTMCEEYGSKYAVMLIDEALELANGEDCECYPSPPPSPLCAEDCSTGLQNKINMLCEHRFQLCNCHINPECDPDCTTNDLCTGSYSCD